jgi:hypothetical protein
MRTFENRAFPMMGSTTSGYWPGLGMRFGWSSLAECDGVLRPIEEGRRCPLSGEDFVPLLLALACRHVDSWSPKDEEHIFDGGEAACVAIAPVFLGLCLLRGGTAI